MDGSDKRDIESRLDILIAHLLKWAYQPGARSTSWVGMIAEQRLRLNRLLKASPSLKSYPADVFIDCHLAGRLLASKESGIDFTLFPEIVPFTIEQVLDLDFLPEEPDLAGGA